jgi:hypothetical protein
MLHALFGAQLSTLITDFCFMLSVIKNTDTAVKAGTANRHQMVVSPKGPDSMM